jgi:ATP-dependent Clp protease ATP-binding subunit ClpA
MFLRVNLEQRACHAFAYAHDPSDRRGDAGLTPAHLALGLLQQGDDFPVYILHSRGVPLDALARELESALPPPGVPRSPPNLRVWTEGDEAFYSRAVREADALDMVFVDCATVLLALLRDGTGVPSRVLARYGVGYGDARAAVEWVRGAEPGRAPPWIPGA